MNRIGPTATNVAKISPADDLTVEQVDNGFQVRPALIRADSRGRCNGFVYAAFSKADNRSAGVSQLRDFRGRVLSSLG